MRRGFVEVDGRLVHFRRTGRGPPLVLLHGSPNSARALAPLMEALGADFDCIGLDTPGNGLSDPLPGDAPSTADYAGALLKSVDALGLRRFSLYGFHTGAGIAAEFAAGHPERVASVILDGLACWTREEQEVMLDGYLPPVKPKWDGSHLAWLWARVTEQSIFFPWHRPSAETRIDYDVRSPEQLHEFAMDFLLAGDNYRGPYAAAFVGDGAARAARLCVPTFITAHPLDPIADHINRLGALPPAVTLKRETREDRIAIWSDFAQFLKRQPAEPTPVLRTTKSRRFVDTECGIVFVRAGGQGAERPLLLIHGAGGSSREFDDMLEAIAHKRPVIALDLPGHGESETGSCESVEDFAEAARETLGALGVDAADAVGRHLGGGVAVELKRRGVVHNAALIGAPIYSDAERREWRERIAPNLSIRWDGAHLLAAWRYLRLNALFDPWFLPDRTHIYWGEPQLDVEVLQRRCVDLLKCGAAHAPALQAQLDYPLAARVKEAGVTQVFTQAGDPLSSKRRVELLAAAARIDAIALPQHSAGALLGGL